MNWDAAGRRTGHSWDIPASALVWGEPFYVLADMLSNGGGGTQGRVRIMRPRVWSLRISGGRPQNITLQCPKALGAPFGGHVTPATPLLTRSVVLQACPAWDHGGLPEGGGGNHRGSVRRVRAAARAALLCPLGQRGAEAEGLIHRVHLIAAGCNRRESSFETGFPQVTVGDTADHRPHLLG